MKPGKKIGKELLLFCLSLLLCVFLLCGCGTGNQSDAVVESTGTAEVLLPVIQPVSEEPVSSSDSAVYTSSIAEDTQKETDTAAIPPSPNLKNDAYFDHSMFIGDSIMEGIRQYVAAERKNQTTLGEAKFLTSIMGITVADLVGDTDPCMYYSYGGKEAPLEELLDGMDINRIFLMLGLNDLSATTASAKEVAERYARLITNLKEWFSDSDIEIIVITIPPKVASSWLPDYVTNRNFGNERINEFVDALIAMCDENEIDYIDAHHALQDETGVLPNEFCRDDYIHLNHAGAKVIVDALYAFAADRN